MNNNQELEMECCKANKLYDLFINWCKERRWDNAISSTGFGHKIGGIVKDEIEAIIKPPRKNDGWYYTINFEKLETCLKNNNRFDEDVF